MIRYPLDKASEPLVRGGQGRRARDVADSGAAVAWLTIAVVVALVVWRMLS